ncbi:MAG: acetyl-CoA carboxylase biotin carboxyl carrier protein [Candidatus Krumholzibacteria bacterium]|nr:acetyl-CoA carboxylase biotin carboxyl carrier protein [Candidatus Krumholzibacteria bacterium]
MSLADRIRSLIDILKEEDLDEIEVRTWRSAVRVTRRRPGGQPEGSASDRPAASAVAVPSGPPAPHPVIETPAADSEPPFEQIVSPMVGTFYRAPSPEADPFVSEGSRVQVGQVLCIIEAMKLMNEIEAERGGVIRKVLVNDAQPVEFGQPLFLIE